jgi:cobyrinic acid a,c-diamide synthase
MERSVRGSAANPRLIVAGQSGDSGKTLFSLGLLLALKDRGIPVRAFKKGPDYIDAAWLSWASGRPARNLDTYLMGFPGCVSAFSRAASGTGVNLIEGNRGLFDGSDARGTHSTAELAKALQAPVLLLINATKVTGTAAAWVLGCRHLDPKVRIGGVILNHVNGARHERVLRDAIESACEVPVLGALPDFARGILLPARHLGLVTPSEHRDLEELASGLRDLLLGNTDLDRIQILATVAPPLPGSPAPAAELPDARGVRLGFLKDSAFSFYYPENLEILESSGAELIPLSALTASAIPPDLAALYIGGGFPETHGAALSANRDFLASLKTAAGSGLPMYAECGGLLLLSRAVRWHAERYPMAEVFPFEVEVLPTPQGHGYVELAVDRPNPFFARGQRIKGHEFHYSRIVGDDAPAISTCAVLRGVGCGQKRDGLVQGNVWASYTHIHALGTPEWARGLLTAAKLRAMGMC